VGYVSGDFNFHSAAIAWTNIVSNHTSRIEPVLYSTLEPHRYDNRTRLWQEAFGNHFIDVSAQSAHELALTIHRDQVDILVDLSGYTNNNRLMTFAYAPAPIRIQAWGYVQGTASPMFTHLFADPVVATPEIRAQLSETVVDLPTILSYLPPSKASGDHMDYPGPTPLPCLTKPPVFCVFQRASKITDDCIATWRTILEVLHDATILFKGSDYTPRIRSRIADGFGDTRGRISFDFHTSHSEHMLWYQDADLALDPWPQTGGVSTLEGFWMHMPCVTLLGERMIQRTSASFLTVLGLEDFIAKNHEEYVRKVVSFVTMDSARLNAVRQTLREKFAASPIIAGYVGHVEDAYRKLWREHCLKETSHGE
jgi:predicted O-linked N-acetylglucosamine transferase (SPINDLY family)